MIRKAGHELVLYYNPEVSSKVMKLKGVLVRMGVRIRNVAPEQVLQPVGRLAGISGYERTENGAVPETELPVIPDEMLVMHGFTGRRIDELLLGLRKAGVPKVELKAVVTESNAGWTFYHLYEEIKELGEPDSVQKVGRPRYRVGETVYFTYGKEDEKEGYGTVEWIDDYGTLGQEKEVSYDIVGIPCELPGEKTLFKHIRESKIQSIDEMEIVRIEREEG